MMISARVRREAASALHIGTPEGGVYEAAIHTQEAPAL